MAIADRIVVMNRERHRGLVRRNPHRPAVALRLVSWER